MRESVENGTILSSMRHVAYTHSPQRSLLAVWIKGTGHVLVRLLQPPSDQADRQHRRRQLLATILLLLALAVQAALVVLIAELVEAIHATMSLYLDLARQHLDLTSLYVAATTPE